MLQTPDKNDALLRHAVTQLRESGLWVFPVMGKRPLPGLLWQETQGTEEQWADPRVTGIALRVQSPFCVVDIDAHAVGCPKLPGCACVPPDEIAAKFGTSSLVSRTGSGGLHLFFADPSGIIPCSTRVLHAQIDTKGSGRGYVVLPPSIHPDTGVRYRWEGEDVVVFSRGVNPMSALPPLPLAYSKALSIARSQPRQFGKMLFSGATQGDRASSAASLAGKLYRLLCGDGVSMRDAHHMVESVLEVWDRKNSPPLGIDEVRRIALSIAKTHYGGNQPADFSSFKS